MATPKLSILILTYRDGADLLRTLRHFSSGQVSAGQVSSGRKSDVEFVIVNVQDTLSTTELETIKSLSLSLRLYSSPINNLAWNRNLALRKSLGDLVLFLDADAELLPFELEKLRDEWRTLKEKNPQLAGLGGVNLPPADEEEFYRLQTDYQKLVLGHLNSPQLWIPEKTSPVNYLSTVFSLFDKKKILQAGAFQNSFEQVCEDQELGFRMKKNGAVFFLSPMAQVIHRSEASWQGWMARVFRFGVGQPAVMFRHLGALLSFKSLALFGSLAVMLASLLMHNWMPLQVAGAAYFFSLVASVRALGRKRFTRSGFGLLIFCALSHLVYVFGLYVGVFKTIYQRFRKVRDLPDEVIAEMT